VNIFESNLQALSGVDKSLFLELQAVQSNEFFDVFLPENNSVDNANIVDTRTSELLYENRPVDAIAEKIKEFEAYEFYQFLYFFGIGNGSFYKKLLRNECLCRIIVFEPEVELLYIALNLVDFSKEIREERVVFKLASLVDNAYLLKIFQNDSRLFLKVYDFHIYSKFYDKYPVEIERMNKGLINGLKHALTVLGNDMDDMLIGIDYSLKSIPQMLKRPTLQELYKKAANTGTAILVATGPSLQKQLPLLKKMQEYVTILSLDASFRILVENGIKPDIVFSLERVKEVKYFFENIDQEHFQDVIFEFPTVVHQDVLDIIPMDVNFYMRRDSYNQFFEFDEWGYLAGGTSVANIVYNFATKSNFERIVLIGQDLSFAEDGSSHTQGHAFGEDQISVNSANEYVLAYGGNGTVASTSGWKSFLNSFNMQVQEADLLTINSTEGGARIEGTEEISFQNVFDSFVNQEKIKEQIRLEKPSVSSFNLLMQQYHKKCKQMIHIGEDMQKKATKILQEIEEFFVKTKDYTQEDIENKLTDYYLDKMVSKVDNLTTKYYNAEPFVSSYVPILSSSISTFDYNSVLVIVMRENNDYDRKLKKMAWINFKYHWLKLLVSNIEKVVAVYRVRTQPTTLKKNKL